MTRASPRRVLLSADLLALSGLLVLVALILAPHPAAADGADQVVLVNDGPTGYYVVSPKSGTAVDQPVSSGVHAVGGTARHVVLTIDTSGTTGVVEWQDSTCESDGAVFTCDIGDLRDGADVSWAVGHAVKGTAPGDSGLIAFHMTASNAAPVDWTIRVTVDLPRLSVGMVPPSGRLQPGRTYPVPVVVRNDGHFPVRGFRVGIESGYDVGFAPTGGRSCQWVPGFLHPEVAGRGRCRFNQVLRPGQSVRLDQPIQVNPLSTLLYNNLDVWAYPLFSSQDDHPADFTIPGTGQAMKLMPFGAEDDAAFDYSGVVHLRADNSADYAVEADTVRGAVGEVVQVVLRVRDLGPAVYDLSYTRKGGNPYKLVFVPPPGTTVIDPRDYDDPGDGDGWPVCVPESEGADRYVCPSSPERRDFGNYDMFFLGLRIDRQVSGATGQAILIQNHGKYSTFDTNTGNDTAPVVVHSYRVESHKRLVIGLVVAGGVVLPPGFVLWRRHRRRMRERGWRVLLSQQ